MLRSLSVDTDITEESFGSSLFLTFESRELSPAELSYLASHSCVVFQALKDGSRLLPLSHASGDYLPEDLPEILKYKGKTNPTFTRMMLNTARALSSFSHTSDPISVLDPLCGRGTTLFSSLCMGANAFGLETDHRDVKECADYFSRYLKTAGMKHSFRAFSETVGSSGVPGLFFSFGHSKEAFRSGDMRSLTLWEGDTALAGSLLRKHPAHLLVSDLPYGVQHAPQSRGRPESFISFLDRVLPAWKDALLPGAGIALSFNRNTLKVSQVRDALSRLGMKVADSPEFCDLAHPVEQAVVRDVVFAVFPS